MIGPVSATGQAMMQSLQNAMSKGMPVDQAIAYVKSMAMDGIAPLTDLYSMMMQFQRLKQPTRRSPEGGSIRENMAMLNQTPQDEGIRQAAGGGLMRDPMEMGLGSMNAGTMENPSFAGGGIVFDQGGGVQSDPAKISPVGTAPAVLTPQFYGPVPKFANYDERAEFYNRLFQNPKFIEQEIARREQLASEQGLGEFAQSFKLRKDLLEADRKRAETLPAEEAKYDEEEYWGDVAENAAESGATLLTSLAKSQKGKATRKRATAEKARNAVREANQTEILLEQAREAEKAGRLKEAEALFTKAFEMADASRKSAIEAYVRAQEAEYSRKSQESVARMQQETLNPLEKRQLNYLNKLDALTEQGKTDTDEYRSTLKLYEIARGGAASRSGNISVLRTLLKGAQDKEKAANEILKPGSIQRQLATPDEIAKAERDIAEAQAQIYELLAGHPELQATMAPQNGAQGGTQGSTELPPGFRPIQ